MPKTRHAVRYWLDAQGRNDRKNARICDKLLLALPTELHPLQRQALLSRFMGELTGGLVPWFAAIHDKGEDSHNPHAHIVIRDRHTQSGRRHLNLSEKGSTKRLHTVWKSILDETLIQYGHQPTPKSQNKARGVASNEKTIQSYQQPLKTHPRATQGKISAYPLLTHP